MATATKKKRKAKAEPQKPCVLASPPGMIEIGSIRVGDNHRAEMDVAKLEELKDSINQVGLLSPIAVHREKGRGKKKYSLIYGHRRLSACKALGWVAIRASVYEGLTKLQIAEMQFIENLQREDLTPIDEARGIDGLLKAGQDVETIAARIDRGVDFVRSRLDLLRLDQEIQGFVASGRIPLKHARLIARVGDPKVQQSLAAMVIGVEYWDGDRVKRKEVLGKALAGDFVEPLKDLRRDIVHALQTLGACGWPMEAGYAGRRACKGCPDNSATEPLLFDAIKLPGKSKKGNCTNKACYQAKAQAWEKDPVRLERVKQREAKRAAKDPESGKTSAGGKLVDKAQVEINKRRKAFPSTPDERLAVALYQHGCRLRDALAGHLRGKASLPQDALPSITSLYLSGVEYVIGFRDEKEFTIKALRKRFQSSLPVAIKRGTMAVMLEDIANTELRYHEPHWQSWEVKPSNVPADPELLELIDCLEALAKRWGVELSQPRPKLEDFQPAPESADAPKPTAKKTRPKRARTGCIGRRKD